MTVATRPAPVARSPPALMQILCPGASLSLVGQPTVRVSGTILPRSQRPFSLVSFEPSADVFACGRGHCVTKGASYDHCCRRTAHH